MLKHFRNLLRDFLRSCIGDSDKETPEALLEAEKEKLRGQIAKYHQALASHAALCERLMTQVRGLEKDERDLRTKTTTHLHAGNREAAGTCALQLQTVQRELTENRRQLEEAESSYRELLAARDVVVKSAQDRIETLRLSLNDLRVKQAIAELAGTSSGLVSQSSGAGNTLDRLTQMVNEERYRATGRARIAQELLAGPDAAFKAFEQKALADEALANFAEREGLTLDDGKAASSGDGSEKLPDQQPQ